MGEHTRQHTSFDTQPDLHMVLDSVSDGLYVLDAEWRFVLFNASAERFFQLERDEVLGRTLWELFPHARGSVLEQTCRQVIEQQVPVTFEIHPPSRPDRYIELRASPLPGGGVAVAFSDVTERKVAEQELARSEQQFRVMAENTLAMIWVSDAQGRVHFANSSYRALFGEPGESLLESWPRRLHTDDVPRCGEVVLGAFREHGPFALEYRAVLQDGQTRWLRCEAIPRRDAEGRFAGHVGVCVDVTEAKRHEAALREATRRLDAILNNTSMAIFLMDERQQCAYMNAAAERLTGYTFEHTQGRPLHDVIHHTHPDGRPYPLQDCPIDRAFPERARVQGEEVFVHRDGHFYPVAFTASPITDEHGRAIGTVIEVRDIAEERERDRVLHETLERYHLVLGATQDTVWDWDVPNDQIVWNDALRTAFGYDPASVEPSVRWWEERVHPDDREAASASLMAAVERGASHWTAEYRFRRADGSYADVLDRGQVLRDEQGRPVRMLGAMLDLSARKAAEHALAESRAYLRTLVDCAAQGFYALDEEGRTTLCNAAFLRMLGYASEEEVLGTPVHDQIHGRHVDGSPYDLEDCPIYRCALDGTPAQITGELFYRTDGTAFPVEYRVSPIVLDGRHRGAICTFNDVSARLQHEAALRESEERFRKMADHAPVLMWVTDAGGRCTYLNRSWYRFTGQTEDEALGRGWLDAIHPDDRAHVERNLLASDDVRAPYRIEYRLRRMDGRHRWMLEHAAPRIDDCGRFFGYIGSVIDFDRRREIEARLRESEARLRLTTEAAAVGTWDFNPITGELRWDERSKALYGLPPEATVDYETFLRGVHPEDRERVEAQVQAALSGDGPDVFETEYRTVGIEDGIERWVAARGRALVARNGDQHRAERFVGVLMDVTAMKRIESQLRELNETLEQRVQEETAERMATEEALRQSQKLEAIGQLTGGVAHDFNNLLTVIRSSVYLLRQPDIDEEKRQKYLAAIRETADRAAKLTAQLLAFARRQPLRPEVFDAAEQVRGSMELLQTTVGGRITLAFDFPETMCCVEADSNQFETALLNLAVNARDAMEGKGTLRLSLRAVDTVPPLHGQPARPGPYVALSVADQGTGIPAERLPRIFEPFYTTKAVGHGTGLGLSQVYGFVKQSGGDIQVESEVGRGTVFTLYLPRVDDEALPRARPPGDSSEEAVPGGGRVLLVEDNRQVGDSTAQLLEQLGYTVVWRRDASSALNLLVRDPDFDIVLSDVVMPGGLTGLELARAVERRHPGLPVVLTSGYSHALAEGTRHPYPLLRKPFTAESLSQALAGALRRARGND